MELLSSMMIPLKKVIYELISGPYRSFKIALLCSFAVFLGIELALWSFHSSVVSILIVASCYIGGLLILIIFFQSRASAKLNDLHYQLSLQTNLETSAYHLKDFYLDGAAASASLMLLLFKCLQLCRPRKILELGSGQTTKMLGNYFRDNPGTYILTLEQDKQWTEILGPYISYNGRCHDYRFSQLGTKKFICGGADVEVSTQWFQDVKDVQSHKFNLILVDGPNGADMYSRSGILEYLPEILDNTFVIIFDDAERYGEITTIRLLRKLLDNTKVEYTSFEVNGIKRQYVFCSKNVEFLKYT